MAEDKNNINDTISSVDELSKKFINYIKLQGDYNNIVKSSIDHLKKLSTQLGKQADFIDDINAGEYKRGKVLEKILESQKKEMSSKTTLKNLTKKLEEEQIKAADDYYDSLIKKQKIEETIAKHNKSGNAGLLKIEQDRLKATESQIQSKENILNVEQMQYIAAKKITQAHQETTKALISHESMMGKIQRKLTPAAEVSKKIYNAGANTAKFIGKTLSEGGGNLFDDMNKAIGQIPVVGAAISGIISGFKSLLDFILEVEDRTVKFGRNLGYSREQSTKIAVNFGLVSEKLGDLTTTTKGLMEAQTMLSEQIGVTNIFSSELLSTQIKLKEILGLGAEEASKLAEASIITGKSQQSLVSGVLGQVAGLAKATGITFNYKQVLKEASTLGGFLGAQFAKYPEKLTKSLLITKALGLDLKKVDQIAGSLLDFESTIQNQLEAQLITGKEINLSKAMQLSLDNKTGELAVELSKQLGTSGEYLQMNRIAAESYAKTFGMTRDELGEMLKQQELLAKIGAKDTDNAQRRLQLAVAKYGVDTKAKEALGEDVYNNLVQLSVQEKIAALIEKVKASVQDFILRSGIIEKIQQMMDYLTSPEKVRGIISMVKEGVAIVADMMQGIAIGILSIAKFFTGGDISAKLGAMRDNLAQGPSMGDRIRYAKTQKVEDFRLQPLPQDTITTNGVTIEGGTRLGRTDEMVDLLKQLLTETKQGKSMTLSIDGTPIATAVSRNAPNNPAASNLGPRPLR
jgi:hypothetical protein